MRPLLTSLLILAHGAGPALLFVWLSYEKAAPAFLLLESWAPRTSPAMFVNHIQALTSRANPRPCPTGFIATTAQDIYTLLPRVAIAGCPCSPSRSIATCCLRF